MIWNRLSRGVCVSKIDGKKLCQTTGSETSR